MKQIIKDVLDDMSSGQINLASSAARELVATTISITLKEYGSYTKFRIDTAGNPVKPINSYLTTDMHKYDLESDIQSEKDKWVCNICGENTHDVNSDYLGTEFNHLECELKLEDWVCDYCDESTHDRDLDPVVSRTRHLKCQLEYERENGERYTEETNRPADEIIDNSLSNDGKYIYESPDSGKTVFRRPFGDYTLEHKEEIDWETKEPTGRLFTDYNNGGWNDER